MQTFFKESKQFLRDPKTFNQDTGPKQGPREP